MRPRGLCYALGRAAKGGLPMEAQTPPQPPMQPTQPQSPPPQPAQSAAAPPQPPAGRRALWLGALCAAAGLVLGYALHWGIAASQSPEGHGEIAARIGGGEISVAQLDDYIQQQLFQRETGGDASAISELRLRELDNLIAEQLLDAEAARRGMSRDDMLDAEAAAMVSSAEVQRFYEENRERFGGADGPAAAEPGPALRRQIRRYLGAQAARRFAQTLRERAGVQVLLEAPRVHFAAGGPSLGPAGAKVTIVEFSDYQCPYCRQAEPIVQQVLREYPEQVRLVFRHFPLEAIHPLARGASEAAHCAAEQGNFWQFHEQLFAARQGLEAASLLRYAESAGLDLGDFRACLAARRGAAQVDADLAEGRRAGVNSTPTFFVNGRRLQGALPIDEFRRIIEAELRAAEG